MNSSSTTPSSIVDPALSVLHRALAGDAGALSFLDRTLSIYVLDMTTDTAHPKTYGSWNFIHQAMNEVERNSGEPYVLLLAKIAKRAARSSPQTDRQLVATCYNNASRSSLNEQEDQLLHLQNVNFELREIVMGRIAAVAFDLSSNSPYGQALPDLTAALAANAISSGPQALQHLLVEWIIPSFNKLPPLAVTFVVRHCASEALLIQAPAGTRNVLQQLTLPCMAQIVLPVFAAAIQSNNGTTTTRIQSSSLLIATCLDAMEQWFVATDLSLPQLKHVAHKANVDLIALINKLFESDSAIVMEALAQWMETFLARSHQMTAARMTQAQHLMNVTPSEFQQAISQKELAEMENADLQPILTEFMASVGMQRFKLIQSNVNGQQQQQQQEQTAANVDVCRNLTRIATRVAKEILEWSNDRIQLQETLIDFLLKAAHHADRNISSLSVELLVLVALKTPSFSFRLLPILQHCAIIPHNIVLLDATNIQTTLTTELQDFDSFRLILSQALVACWQQEAKYYMDSCTSAIEEFCASTQSKSLQQEQETAFQLEAALYCLVVVAPEAVQQENAQDSSTTTRGNAFDEQLTRCMVALAHYFSSLQTTPNKLLHNPLTIAQMCQFLASYATWIASTTTRSNAAAASAAPATPQALLLDSAAELALSVFTMVTTTRLVFSQDALEILKNMSPASPFSRAATALEAILTSAPQHFTGIPAITVLGRAWESSYAASSSLSVKDRKRLCRGICSALAALPEDQRAKSFLALSLPTVDCLEKMTKFANDSSSATSQAGGSIPKINPLDSVLIRIGDEVQILATMTSSFSEFLLSHHSVANNGDESMAISLPRNHAHEVIQRTWPCLTHLARTYYAQHEAVALALGEFLTVSIPKSINGIGLIALFKDYVKLACFVLRNVVVDNVSPQPVYDFVAAIPKIHGNSLEQHSLRHSDGNNDDSNGAAPLSDELASLVHELLLACVEASRASLWTTQTTLWETQGQGQEPFECKIEPRPVTQERERSSEALSGLFLVLTVYAQTCPGYLAGLSSTTANEDDGEDDRLLVGAIEAAVAALVEAHDGVSRSALIFLKAVIDMNQSHGAGQEMLDNILARTGRSIVMMVISGACGTFAHVTLEPAALLLLSMLQTIGTDQLEPWLVEALQQEQFRLGDDARSITISVFRKCSTPGGESQLLLVQLFSDVWALHQTNDASTGGDAVLKFVEKYAE